MLPAFYNEIDQYAAQWLRNLIAEGLIPDGEVCERSIEHLRPSDLDGFGACHFFAGLGGWAYALRLAGVPDDFPVWTGSCPCQPFSVAGKRKGFDDDRHLWPVWYRLIAERRPPVVLGEQVASAAAWLAGVRGDLEKVGFAVGALPIEAASVGAPHKRDRYWFVADATGARSGAGLREAGAVVDGDGAARSSGGNRPVAHPNQPRASEGREQRGGQLGGVGGDSRDRLGELADAIGRGRPRFGGSGQEGAAQRCDDDVGDARRAGLAFGPVAEVERGDVRREGPPTAASGSEGEWGAHAWLLGADGKARRVEPGIRLLAHGVPNRVAKLRALGNAIVPQVAAEFIRASLDAIADNRPTPTPEAT